MPKMSTLKIQYELLELGEKLGFISCIEERIHNNDIYSPIYDAIWYLDLTKYIDIMSLERLLKNAPHMIEKIKKFPIAGFEVEGASTSSKNQIGNFGNLYSGNFLYNFVIVNNGEANGENDTYRRGRKLYRYFHEEFEEKNIIFMDYTHFKKSISNLDNHETGIDITKEATSTRKNFGGDTTSIEMYKKIFPLLEQSGLEIKQNYSPQMPTIKFKQIKSIFKSVDNEDANFWLGKYYHNNPEDTMAKVATKASDVYYIPKLDVVAGFNLPSYFSEWLYQISVALSEDCVNFPILYALKHKLIDEIFIPLISIEFENTINKHCNGGIINMSHYSYFGILVGNDSAEMHIKFLKENMGINNVTFLTVGDLK